MRPSVYQTNYQTDISPDEHRDMKVLARLVYGVTLREFMTDKVRKMLSTNRAAIDAAKRTIPPGTNLDEVLDGRSTKLQKSQAIFD